MAGRIQISRALIAFFCAVLIFVSPPSEKEKMQIQVKCSCGDGKCPEWAIIELQGVVEAQPSIENRIQNLEIGRLCHSSSQGNFTFTVGYHELSGTKIPLKKPLLVLKKKKVVEEDEPNPRVSSRAELEIIGIIRQRILFKTRPKALISRPQIKEKKAVGSNRTVD